MKGTIKAAIITGTCGIIAAIVSFDAGSEKVEQKIENQVSQVLKIDNESAESAVEYLVERVKELEDENGELTQQLEEAKKEMKERAGEDSTSIVQNENFQDNEDGEYVSLLSVAKVVDPCNGFEIMQTDTMSLRGDNYTNGFILHYYDNTEGVEFNLGSKYSKMKFKIGHLDETEKEGTFTLTYTLDGEIQPVISIQPEDPVKEIDIDLKKAKMLKLNWSNNQGFAEYGMADVMIAE